MASQPYTRIKESIPYTGKGVDPLITAVRTILQDTLVQKIQLEAGSGRILVEKLVPEDDPRAILLSWHDAVRARPMEEYVSEVPNLGPSQQLWDAMSMISLEGLEIGAVLVGNVITFRKWLDVHISLTRPNVFGVPLIVDGVLPKDVYIICGTRTRDCDPSDVEYSVKGLIP